MELDSARDAFVALEGAKNLQFPLTGPFISIAPVTTGPWYWIQLILAKKIFLTPYAPWLLLCLYSTATVYIFYLIGIHLENPTFGLILATIACLSPSQITNATLLTNPSVIGFFSSLVVLTFIKLLKEKDNAKLGLIFGILLGLTINTHYQSFGLLSLPILLLVYKRKSFTDFLNIVSGLIATFVPLIFFELNNHWFNIKHLILYFLVDQYKIWVPNRWLTFIFEYWPKFIAFSLGGRKLFGAVIMILISAVFGYKILTKKLKSVYLLLIISFLLQVILVRYYRGEKFYGYLQFFLPYLFIFTGYVIYQSFNTFLKSLLGITTILIYCLFVLPTSIDQMKPAALTLETKKLVENMKTKFGQGPYKIYKCKEVTKQEINALVLLLEMNKLYQPSGKPLMYFWGCTYPRIKQDGSIISDDELKNPDLLFPGFWNIKDISIASSSALINYGWVEASPKSMYQSAARWWFDEQP